MLPAVLKRLMLDKVTAAGLIHSTCSAIQVAEDAIADARSICLRQYGNAPSVSVRPLLLCYQASALPCPTHVIAGVNLAGG